MSREKPIEHSVRTVPQGAAPAGPAARVALLRGVSSARTEQIRWWVVTALAAALVAGCASGVRERPPGAAAQGAQAAETRDRRDDAVSTPLAQARAAVGEPAGESAGSDGRVVRLGSGRFVNPEPPPPWIEDRRGNITLNFDNADLHEVVKIILRDILQQNYVIDPRVQGKATIQTTRPLARDSVWAVLETVLQINGAALVREKGAIPRIVPLDNAVHVGPPAAVVGSRVRRGAGYGIEILPLQYVSARQMAKNLEGFIAPGASVRADEQRNLLILTGPRHNLRQLIDTVAVFDVDWLQGLSFALLPLSFAAPDVLVADLQKIVGAGDGSALSGVLRLEVVERLNALLVVSTQPRYIAEIEALVRELDQGTNAPGRRLHVYQVENGSADYIADILNQLFGEQVSEDEAEPRQPAADALLRPLNVPRQPELVPRPVQPPAESPAESPAAGGDAGPAPLAQAATAAGQIAAPVSIIADSANNALLIMASPADYRIVQTAIRHLDVRPRQVLIEATIAEVTLSDNLQYGVQWFLKGNSEDSLLRSALSSTSSAALPSSAAPGFFFSITDGVGDVRLLFDLLANESELKVLSSPQVLVIDNETASIRVGDQIPVITRQTSATGAGDSPLVNEVQFRDTGVLLQVTPRINAGGLVTMKINQEVSEPSADEFAAGNVSILQRTIESSVSVRSREAVLLGGLIRENNTKTLTGIPGLMHLPLIGRLFSRTVDNVSRTELIVTITPTVIHDQADANEAAAELRRRLGNVERWLEEIAP